MRRSTIVPQHADARAKKRVTVMFSNPEESEKIPRDSKNWNSCHMAQCHKTISENLTFVVAQGLADSSTKCMGRVIFRVG